MDSTCFDAFTAWCCEKMKWTCASVDILFLCLFISVKFTIRNEYLGNSSEIYPGPSTQVPFSTLSLDHQDLVRYKEKLTVTVDNIDILLLDPYISFTDWFVEIKKLPPTQYLYPTIYYYLDKTPEPEFYTWKC